MERYIKYKRIYLNDIFKVQETFDDIIKEGWEIIHYQETSHTANSCHIYNVIIVCGKKQEVF